MNILPTALLKRVTFSDEKSDCNSRLYLLNISYTTLPQHPYSRGQPSTRTVSWKLPEVCSDSKSVHIHVLAFSTLLLASTQNGIIIHGWAFWLDWGRWTNPEFNLIPHL